jgi:hypothetical protein
LQHNVIEGVLDQSDERLEWARISKGIMGLVEQIEKGELPKQPENLLEQHEPLQTTTDQAGKPKTKLTTWVLPLVAGALVLLFLLPKLLEHKPANPTSAEEKTAEIQLQEMPGKLIWYDESPVADALISIKGRDEEYTARSDSKGFFTLKIKPDLIDELVEFKVNIKGKEQTETIRLIPENIEKYTLSK